MLQHLELVDSAGTLGYSLDFYEPVMLQLSRQGWNNIIIYGVLALFFLFYTAPNHLAMLRSKELQQVVAPGQRLLELHFPRAKLKQAGPVWRVEPALSLTEGLAEQTVAAWQQLALPAVQNNDRLLAQICVVELTLSGEQERQRWRLLLDDQQYYLESAAGFYPILAEQVLQLCPVALR